jgi:uncharacterized membrane protein YfcA
MRALIVLVVIGFVAQLVDGALGMAYGATSSTLLLAYGLTPAAASASVHLAELGTTAVSGFSHWRFGNVEWKTVRRIGVPGAFGALLGAVVLSSISTQVAKPWMAGILFSLGLIVLIRFTIFGPAKPRGRRHVRHRYLAPLGLFAGFVDATGGGGWGPVATPTLLSTGKMEPRKVVGSVDTSEFLVALAASIGFLATLGAQGVDFKYVAALLIGGVVAAPIAAWIVRIVTPSLLGASVGGVILITNSRTLFSIFKVPGSIREPIYWLLAVVWVSAIAWVVWRHRRDGAPLWNRVDTKLATDQAGS